jgi:Na+/H+ antiporter NhaD/arsenite permease-like protein
VLWTTAVILTPAAACLRRQDLLPAARATAGPFATLAAIIGGSVLVGRLGVFRALAGLLIRDRAPRAVATASVLAFTALLSGLVNLDVAVVVAAPVALEAARRHGPPAGRVCVAVAITANAASFLLPTSNITNLLLLGRTSLPALAYMRGSWLAWLLVVAVTVGPLTGWLAPAGIGPARTSSAGPSGRTNALILWRYATASRMPSGASGSTSRSPSGVPGLRQGESLATRSPHSPRGPG